MGSSPITLTINLFNMKRITEEQAERIPQHLSIRKHLNKINANKCDQIQSSWSYKDHHISIHPWTFIKRFISKYIGKEFDLCYSDFRRWLKNNRKLRNDYVNIVRQFKNNFTNFESPDDYSFCYFTINSEGIIDKLPEQHKKRNPIYKEYVYKFIPKDDPYSWSRISEFKRRVTPYLYEKCVKGLTEEEFRKYSIWYPYLHYYLTKVGVGEPITDKRLIARYFQERASKQRKFNREAIRNRKERIAFESIGSFETKREEKKRLKKLAQERAKEEEANNIIERDRLGFNEESFKTSQKFTNHK